MASTYLSLHYHLVFSTKDRRPLIHSRWRRECHQYLGGTVRGLGGIAEDIDGIDDHVHLLVGLKATHCLASFMRELKKASSIWAKEKYEPRFGWQDGYAAFTVSGGDRARVREYIRTQEQHHQQINFTAELIQLLESHNVDYDSKYLL